MWDDDKNHRSRFLKHQGDLGEGSFREHRGRAFTVLSVPSPVKHARDLYWEPVPPPWSFIEIFRAKWQPLAISRSKTQQKQILLMLGEKAVFCLSSQSNMEVCTYKASHILS